MTFALDINTNMVSTCDILVNWSTIPTSGAAVQKCNFKGIKCRNMNIIGIESNSFYHPVLSALNTRNAMHLEQEKITRNLRQEREENIEKP